MQDHNLRALRLAKRTLASLEGPLSELVPSFQNATPGMPDRIVLTAPSRDGAAHAVSILPHGKGLTLMLRDFARETVPPGLVVEREVSSSIGRRFAVERESEAIAFVATLAQALLAAPHAFEPRRAPGLGIDGVTGLMATVARNAIAALEGTDPGRGPLTVTLNDPPPAHGRDVLRFLDADGEPLPLAMRPGRHYAIEVFDPAAGEILVRSDDLSGYGTLRADVDRLLAERAPAPSRPAP